MKLVILAGGFGSRLGEETSLIPKPMVQIGGKPIIWHLISYYKHYGINDFIICAGYKQEVLKSYFQNLNLYESQITTFNYSTQQTLVTYSGNNLDKINICVVDTGLNTMTGGRLKRIRDLIGEEEFLLTYGDGLSDVNITELISFHKKNKKILTLTAIPPISRFGKLEIDSNNNVIAFKEKSVEKNEWINGGFMVSKSEIFDFIDGDSTIFEKDPMAKLSQINQIMAFKHTGNWNCMDTIKDKEDLESIWKSKNPYWKKW